MSDIYTILIVIVLGGALYLCDRYRLFRIVFLTACTLAMIAFTMVTAYFVYLSTQGPFSDTGGLVVILAFILCLFALVGWSLLLPVLGIYIFARREDKEQDGSLEEMDSQSYLQEQLREDREKLASLAIDSSEHQSLSKKIAATAALLSGSLATPHKKADDEHRDYNF